jgi:TonB-like protein
MLRPPEYPATTMRARMAGESTHEVLVDRTGKVRDVQIVGATFMVFALSTDASLRATSYFPATLDGKPVATRFWVRVPFGALRNIESSPARNRVTAFVPGDEPSRARWQLTDAVHRVTVVADVASVPPAEVSVVAVAPGGAKRVLVPSGKALRRTRETVKTGNFFALPGDYQIRLQHGERLIAEGLFTVAADERSAVVNACSAE